MVDVNQTYNTSRSGFRWRLLQSQPGDDYHKIVDELRDSEKLYRMMDSERRSQGELFPVLIGSEEDYEVCMTKHTDHLWRFQLAGGIPVKITAEEVLGK